MPSPCPVPIPLSRSSLATPATSPRRLALVLILLVSHLALAASAAAWEVDEDAPAEDFRAFHRRFSADAYHYPRHGAAPLGLIGFEVFVDASYDEGFDDEPFAATVLDDDLPGGFLSVARVGVRKGLPAGIDLGASYARALGGDVELISADVQYAISKGGAVTPAFSVRVTGTRTLDAGAYELDQYGAELLLSKGFAVVTPYLGGGVVRSEGSLSSPLRRIEESDTQAILYGGVVINLLLPKIVVEVEKAEEIQGAVRLGFGF